MLSLFKEEMSPLSQDLALKTSQKLLIRYLNEGLIPTWEDFFQNLPGVCAVEDLDLIKQNFIKITQWTFLKDIINLDATEFYFHSPQDSQYLLLNGEKRSIELPLTEEEWQLWLEVLSIHFKQNWNVQQPFASFYGKLFEKEFRLSLVHGSTSPQGKSKLILRVLALRPHPLESFGDSTTLKRLVEEKRNVLVAGATGSGKTSLLTSLLTYVPQEEHLVILEDTYEILLPHSHQTRFLAGTSMETSLKSYLSYTLRLSPDRIILGEMRSHEVTPFLMAMNTGHKGLMGTIHASSAVDALNRIALLFTLYAGEANLNFEKVMELICRNLEYVVFVNQKKVTEIIKILGSDKGIAFYERVSSFEGGDEEI